MDDLIFFLFWIIGLWMFESTLGASVRALNFYFHFAASTGRIFILFLNAALAVICVTEGQWVTSDMLEFLFKYTLYLLAFGVGCLISCSVFEWEFKNPKEFFSKQFYGLR